jgi:hypothetical protein
MSLRKTGLTGRHSASAAAGLAYASFAMTTVLLRDIPGSTTTCLTRPLLNPAAIIAS